MMKAVGRKKHTSWKNLPSFFDVSGSVSVATFGARRLPEIKALWAQVEQQNTQLPSISAKALESGGGKKSSRHLRRRTTSYKRRIRHRFPAAAIKPPSESQCRKARRRCHRLHMRECAPTPPASRTDEPPVHWIANHIWHAKRFHTCNLWNWRVPMLHSNRGAKAALRLAQERTLVQEATWCQRPIRCTCSDVPLLSQCLLRIIPSFTIQTSRGVSVGSGTVHEVDSFPKRALGPVTWIWTRHGELFEGVDDTSVVLLVHPCIQQSVLKELDSIAALKACVYTEQQLCCLRLRGFQPDICIAKAFEGLFSLESQKEVDTFFSDNSPSHLDAIQLNDANANLLIVRKATHDNSVFCNLGVLGFDIYCSAGTAKSLFQSLVLAGGAAPIGLTEWSHLLQDAHPPVPVFPRDWPDTPSGVEYWQTDGIWCTVRRYLEGGSGRINPIGPPLRSVQWAELIDGVGDEDVVVVRDAAFGKPFEEALAASGSHYSTHETSQSHPRRPRRSPTPPFVTTPKLSVEDAKAFFASCNALIQSLTLPALLLCHITVFGKGVLRPNDTVFFDQRESGIVTSGSFSPARGQFHGIAVIGASRFLSHVAAVVSSGSNTFAVRECDGKRSIQLGVSVRRGDQSVFGTLSLIL
ncbi:ribonuclease P/MRP protein subunit POP1 [Fistulifera solaris]|uniref:Ribonuclease P/MRP protein subunit POP1 n=1 Tax=Fistulifera solaris TaxID=1519565 RepID=A0A1Z5JHU1_FISSO|nr:ribonuclease P/MRP protein subunit POP1 [Fistulifera solaris]|eukprot:GAX13422.1 ribonuclease P/MRP protein subunit POP1 [Fistulifera solaris]